MVSSAMYVQSNVEVPIENPRDVQVWNLLENPSHDWILLSVANGD